MKKFFVVIATLMLFAACSKDNVAPAEEKISTKATVDYMGDPAVDGFGWVLKTGDSFEIPTDLSDEFKVDELKVNVVYTRSTVIFPCHCTNPKQMVNIVTISRSF